MGDEQSYTDAVVGYIGKHAETIRSLEAQIKSLQAHIQEFATDCIENADNEYERIELASTLYWEVPEVKPSVICDALGIYPQAVKSTLYPGYITNNCADCGLYFETRVTSRTDREAAKNRTICPDCRRIREAQNAELEAQYAQMDQDRAAAIQLLKTMPYAQYLKTDHWLNVRRKMLKRAGYRCQLCNADGVSLHVHHRTYERRGEEEYQDLIVLCGGCHETFHTNGVLA